MELFKLAWRNLWRNKKRTLITIASIFFGVIWAVFISSLQSGSFQNMIDNMVRFSSGHIQIQSTDFRELKSINNSFELSKDIQQFLEDQEEIIVATPKIESFALIATNDKSYATAVVGIHPENEILISNFPRWIVDGRYLNNGEKGIILGDVLARNLDAAVGDTMALIGQGYHGVNTAGLFPVTGILSFPLPDLNRQILYMDIGIAQDFFQLENRITSMVIMLDKPSHMSAIIETFNNTNFEDVSILSWPELLPELVQFIDGKVSSAKLIKGVLFLLIAFGILATFIMMVSERKRELGIMIAIGMNRMKLSIILFLESILIGALGVISGFLLSLPVILFYVNNPIPIGGKVRETYIDMGFEPIIMFNADMPVFTGPALTIFVFAVLIALYPVSSIIRMKIVNSLQA